LLNRGANIEAKNKGGNTALHLAALRDHETMARLLLGGGADIEATNRYGHTALHLAYQRHQTVAKLLLDRGANIAAKDEGRFPEGRTSH
jgi:ankyrin repeat protein